MSNDESFPNPGEELTSAGHSPQSADKSQSEEPPESENSPILRETEKAKKFEADLADEKDRPPNAP